MDRLIRIVKEIHFTRYTKSLMHSFFLQIRISFIPYVLSFQRQSWLPWLADEVCQMLLRLFSFHNYSVSQSLVCKLCLPGCSTLFSLTQFSAFSMRLQSMVSNYKSIASYANKDNGLRAESLVPRLISKSGSDGSENAHGFPRNELELDQFADCLIVFRSCAAQRVCKSKIISAWIIQCVLMPSWTVSWSVMHSLLVIMYSWHNFG